MVTLIIVAGIFLLLLIIGAIFGGDDDTADADYESDEKVSNTENSLEKENQQVPAVSAHDKTIDKLMKKNELLSAELAFSQKSYKQLKTIVNNIQKQYEKSLTDKFFLESNIESMKNIIDSQQKTIEEKSTEQDDDLQFLRHTIKNMILETSIRLDDVKEYLGNKNFETASNIINEIHEETRNSILILETLLYDAGMIINICNEIDLAKRYLSLRHVANYKLMEDAIDHNNYYYFTPCLPTAISMNLIENAIKYGDRSHPDFLYIEYMIADDTFTLYVRNRLNKAGKKEIGTHHGIGINNVCARLQNMYSPTAFSLETNSDDNYYYTHLKIKLN
ncbi:MAG: hypothetical protein IJT51_01555 [Bacteroidales bacterium]|nr:hypothetical protein [Bacteroidales bacterium]